MSYPLAPLKRGLAFFLLVALCFAANADASIKVGDLIRFQDGPGSPGGEFGIAHASTPTVTEFITFCVEKNEYINFSSNFYVESISMTADAGGVSGGPQDPVGPEAQWLYYNFRMGTLVNYIAGGVNDTSTARTNSANALQNAIWFLEGEITNAGSGQAYVDLAVQELFAYNNSSNYSGNMATAMDRVRIMNIRWNNANGDRAQSQMFMVPEPTAMSVWASIGLSALFVRRRQK